MAHPILNRPNYGSDTEIVWASPAERALVQTLQAESPAPVFSDDGRARRARGSSDDNEDEPLELEGFINEDLRAGGPYLCPLPVLAFPLPSAHPLAIETNNSNQLFHAIESILKTHNIVCTYIDFLERQAEWDPKELGVPTVLVYARKSQLDETWLKASKEIHSLLFQKNLVDVSVEIADPRVFEPMQYYPILPADTIYPIWDAVCDAILDLHIQGCRAVECFRYGRDTNGQNPQMVIVTVSPSAKSRFKQTREQIVNILNRFQLPTVGVSIIKGEIERSDTLGQWRLPLDGPKEGGKAGLSLGKHGISDSSGTFGGWVEIQDPTNGWLRLGLTCFHCVDPAEQADIAPSELVTKWYTHGIRANDVTAKKYLKVDQPSVHDIENDLAVLDKLIKDNQNDECYVKVQALLQAGESVNQPDMEEYKRIEASLREDIARKSHIERFRASKNRHLGHVYAGSGYREKPVLRESYGSWETIMDWALIDVRDSRVGDNDITIHGTPVIPNIKNLTTLKGWDMTKPLDKYGNGGTEDLYKVGRSTGFTAGWYNGSIKSAHVATKINQHGEKETKVTKEHAIAGVSGQSFSAPGDSGSFVFTRKGEVVGMIFAARKDRSVSYFTPIWHLFDDIRDITGCIGVRIYA